MPLGKFTVVRLGQVPIKQSGILCTFELIDKLVIALPVNIQLACSFIQFVALYVIAEIEEVPLNAPVSSVSRLVPRVTADIPVQLRNAYVQIRRTLFGIVSEPFIPEQPLKA